MKICGRDVGSIGFGTAGIAASSVRSEVLIATKGGHRRQGQNFPVDATPGSLRSDCELSLRALGVDTIDLYQLHHIDPRVPFIESVGALRELQIAYMPLGNGEPFPYAYDRASLGSGFALHGA